MKKYERMISLVLVAASSLSALFFIIKQNMDAAILSMTIMFTITNFFRSRTFKEKGHDKEANWMRKMSMIFAILSVLVVVIMLNG
ncbi:MULTISPECIES: hypothetical protein [Solibacillus]|uniref:Aspartyl/asparaginyl-tRNA synthetase n=1 Tax=Solibacillus palustris TaxID=2908203 RepID=A0ABS9UH24_9BACL|nr:MULTISPECIES: hypothetical protein [Solibacillus]MCH7323651.1 hypothetical protein [Solibacillus sp. MA9]